MPLRAQILIGVLAMLSTFFIGLQTGHSLYSPELAKPELYSPEKRLKDGSLSLEKTPQNRAISKQALPPHSKIERVLQAKISSKKPNNVAPGEPCPDVTVDTTIYRDRDGQTHVAVSSPDGVVVSGNDTPILNLSVGKELKWAAGISYNSDKEAGIWVDRNIGAFRVGIELEMEDREIVGTVKVGLRF